MQFYVNVSLPWHLLMGLTLPQPRQHQLMLWCYTNLHSADYIIKATEGQYDHNTAPTPAQRTCSTYFSNYSKMVTKVTNVQIQFLAVYWPLIIIIIIIMFSLITLPKQNKRWFQESEKSKFHLLRIKWTMHGKSLRSQRTPTPYKIKINW